MSTSDLSPNEEMRRLAQAVKDAVTPSQRCRAEADLFRHCTAERILAVCDDLDALDEAYVTINLQQAELRRCHPPSVPSPSSYFHRPPLTS